MLPLHHHRPNVIVLLSFPTPTIDLQTVKMSKLSSVYKVYKYQNISTTAVVYCCTVCGTVFCFSPRLIKFSVHGTISSYVVFQNIVIIAVLTVDLFSPSQLLSVHLLHGTRVTREKIALVSPLKLPCMATYIKPGILKAGKTGYLYMRHRKIRDRRVVYNVQLYHK